MGSYRSSGRGIQVPLLAIANEFIRIHVYTAPDPRCGDSILRAEPPFWKSCLRPCTVRWHAQENKKGIHVTS